MANINWDSQELESTAAQVNTLLQNYDKTMDEIQQTLNTMEFRLKLRTDVDNDLSKLKRRVSQERSKMQQVRQTVNLAASRTTDLNGKLIGYTNDIGDLSIKSNTTNISAGNSVNFLQWTALGSLGISGMVDVISGFVSKIGSWLVGKRVGRPKPLPQQARIIRPWNILIQLPQKNLWMTMPEILLAMLLIGFAIMVFKMKK